MAIAITILAALLLVLNLHGTEVERPLAIVMIGGLVTSTLLTRLALPTFYMFVHQLQERFRSRRGPVTHSDAVPEVVAP
ncbi:MAG: efflux RND transporter permease subunit [Thermoanaerobaculia bacterium]